MQSSTILSKFTRGWQSKGDICTYQLGESNSCFHWAYGAQCFFAVGRCGQSLLLFLFELAAGCMFVLKLSEQIENQLIGLKTSWSDSFKTNMHPAVGSNKNNNKDCPHQQSTVHWSPRRTGWIFGPLTFSSRSKGNDWRIWNLCCTKMKSRPFCLLFLYVGNVFDKPTSFNSRLQAEVLNWPTIPHTFPKLHILTI